MPRFFHCIHCGQPHTTADECRQHEAECPWRIRAFEDQDLCACPTCSNLITREGRYCAAKKGALITAPVSLCRLHNRPGSGGGQAHQTGAAEELPDEMPAPGSRPLAQEVA